MKLIGGIELSTKNRLHFGTDPDSGMDLGSEYGFCIQDHFYKFSFPRSRQQRGGCCLDRGSGS